MANGQQERYTVTVNPDGSAQVYWPEGGSHMSNNAAAILDRDSTLNNALVALLEAVKGGYR